MRRCELKLPITKGALMSKEEERTKFERRTVLGLRNQIERALEKEHYDIERSSSSSYTKNVGELVVYYANEWHKIQVYNITKEWISDKPWLQDSKKKEVS